MFCFGFFLSVEYKSICYFFIVTFFVFGQIRYLPVVLTDETTKEINKACQQETHTVIEEINRTSQQQTDDLQSYLTVTMEKKLIGKNYYLQLL